MNKKKYRDEAFFGKKDILIEIENPFSKFFKKDRNVRKQRRFGSH